jgi:predicted N-acetyltransferase YhbS
MAFLLLAMAAKPAAPGAVHAPLTADRQDVSHIVPLNMVAEKAIEHLLDAAFGPDRHGRTAYLIRDGMPWLPELSFGILDEHGELVGSLQSWPVALTDQDGAQTPLIMVGPVAVSPALQGAGHGRALMDAVVTAARNHRSEPLMMIGDPEYYGRFWGFTANATKGWTCPGPFEARRLLALSVDGRALGGQGMLGPRITARA